MNERDVRVACLINEVIDYKPGSTTWIRLISDAMRDEFSAGYAIGRRASLDESDVAAGLTSATARLIGLSKRDGRLEAIDHGVVFLTEIVNRLNGFAGICGSDTGAEGVVVVLREMIGYLKARDYDGASAALTQRMAARGSAEHRQHHVELAARELVAAEEVAARQVHGPWAKARQADERCEEAWERLQAVVWAEAPRSTSA